jgi:plasmid maintenance system killer protein
MKVHYTKKALKKMYPDWQCLRSFGDNIGRKILLRISQFEAANCLEDLRNLAGRHEELTGNRKEQLSCRLTANWRLIYQPFGERDDYIENGGLDWKKVTEVEIVEADDYHGN